MRFVPVPGLGIPTHDIPLLDPDRNLAAWIDRNFIAFTQRALHTGRLYGKTRDPEGLLSTLPAIATTLIGSLTALTLRLKSSSPKRTCTNLIVSALALMIAGGLWNSYFPINKNLWTSSYVLFAAGSTLLGISLAYWLIDIQRLMEKSRLIRGALWPWLIFGSNAVVVLIFSDFLVKTLIWLQVNDRGNRVSTWEWIYLHVFARQRSTEVTSLLFAISVVIICFLPNWLLWQKRLFIKI